ncbi:hypothetical protein TREMEDRAFT_71861, partial [Tremella mesenterica DSM 1558]|uniref:uncharacterized protein n=1 Tax=Tremella mesenterica (strain ATCC 24925 / CBS 8224 / DSM 1558 / NBRC 9311 / NRRL Y-6157 / RJB 2259-6 / UBC 559-6) TaxID=578456 RepID=UPI0003F48C99
MRSGRSRSWGECFWITSLPSVLVLEHYHVTRMMGRQGQALPGLTMELDPRDVGDGSSQKVHSCSQVVVFRLLAPPHLRLGCSFRGFHS